MADEPKGLLVPKEFVDEFAKGAGVPKGLIDVALPKALGREEPKEDGVEEPNGLGAPNVEVAVVPKAEVEEVLPKPDEAGAPKPVVEEAAPKPPDVLLPKPRGFEVAEPKGELLDEANADRPDVAKADEDVDCGCADVAEFSGDFELEVLKGEALDMFAKPEVGSILPVAVAVAFSWLRRSASSLSISSCEGVSISTAGPPGDF